MMAMAYKDKSSSYQNIAKAGMSPEAASLDAYLMSKGIKFYTGTYFSDLIKKTMDEDADMNPLGKILKKYKDALSGGTSLFRTYMDRILRTDYRGFLNEPYHTRHKDAI